MRGPSGRGEIGGASTYTWNMAEEPQPEHSRVYIETGPFKGMFGTLVSQDQKQLKVKVLAFGREVPVDLSHDQARVFSKSQTLAQMWTLAAQHAPTRWGYRNRLTRWWAQRAQEPRPLDDAAWVELMARFRSLQREVDAQLEAHLDSERQRFEEEFGELDLDGMLRRWQERRSAWTDRSAPTEPLWETGQAIWRDANRVYRALLLTRHPLTDPQPLPPALDEAQRRALQEAPFDRAQLEVLSDQLLEAEDPRNRQFGQMLSEALQDGSTEEPSMAHAELSEAALGPLVHFRDNLQLELQWGFLKEARLALTEAEYEARVNAEQLLAAMLELPIAQMLQGLTLGVFNYEGENNYNAVLGALFARPRPTLRSLFIGDHQADEQELSWTGAGDLEALSRICPNLEALKIRAGNMQLAPLELPALRSLVIETGGLSQENMQAILQSSLPELRELSLWFGRPDFGASATAQDLASLLAGALHPKLEHLGLMNSEFTDALCKAIEPACLRTLRTLDFSMGTMTDEGARQLAQKAEALAHLTSIDVSDNYLSEDGLLSLRGLEPEVVSTSQRTARLQGGQAQRYALVGE